MLVQLRDKHYTYTYTFTELWFMCLNKVTVVLGKRQLINHMQTFNLGMNLSIL